MSLRVVNKLVKQSYELSKDKELTFEIIKGWLKFAYLGGHREGFAEGVKFRKQTKK